MRRLASASLELLETAAAHDWRGSDPYDALGRRWPAALRSGRRRRQALIQLHARAPIDIRRARRGRPQRITKALGVFGSAAARLLQISDDPRIPGLCAEVLAAVDGDRASGTPAWGYPWDVQTRWSFYPADSPNVVVTTFAAEGLADGAAALGEPRLLERARDAARWVRDELYTGDFFAYHEHSRALIHNANMLGARLVHRLLEDDAAARAAVERTLEAQQPDGSWPYGDDGNLGFVDSFHTGYVLDSLLAVRDVHERIDAALRAGSRYYAESFFRADGAAALWPHRRYPEDGHSAGTGLTTLAHLAEHGYVDRELVDRVAGRVLDRGIRRGHAVHRRGRLGATTVRYIRWCDAHVALGLADAALALRLPPLMKYTNLTIPVGNEVRPAADREHPWIP
jgi:hypothetical protein